MINRWGRFAIVLAILLGAIAADGGFGQSAQEARKTAFSGYLKYTYRMNSGTAQLSETTTTEITPTLDGRYQVVTTTQAISDPDEVRLGFFGVSLQWLGLYMSEESKGRFDVSQLSALSDQVLDPHKTYLLPDGGLLQTADRVTVAGLSGVEGVYTKPSAVGVTITVVLADDLQVRQLLPFPLRVNVEYSEVAGGDGSGVTRSYSGQIELVEYTTVKG